MEGYLGQVLLFAGLYPPKHWAYCEGQLLPISQYQALYSILGNTFGGDNRQTFALPDLRSAQPPKLRYIICVEGIYPMRAD